MSDHVGWRDVRLERTVALDQTSLPCHGACDRHQPRRYTIPAKCVGVDLDADQLDLVALRREEAFLLRDEQRPVTDPDEVGDAQRLGLRRAQTKMRCLVSSLFLLLSIQIGNQSQASIA